MSFGNKDNKIIESYKKAHFSINNNGYLSIHHSFMREDVILHMYEYMLFFRKAFLTCGWESEEIRDKKVLEVGSAWGLRLIQLLGFSFKPCNMYGIDLIESYVEEAKRYNPLINYEVMSAMDILYKDNFFDFSFACVTLSAMHDESVIDSALSEMCRVSKNFVLIIDNFDSSYENWKNGVLYLKGVKQSHIEKLKYRTDVTSVIQVGSCWTTSKIAWDIYAILKKIGLESIAYAVAIRMLSRHSHKAFLIKLNKA